MARAKEPLIEILNRVSRTSVLKHTDQDWNQWIQSLNKAGAAHWERRQIVAFLKTKFRLTPWWQQVVASGYEVATGRRAEGRNLKGEFSITATKTVPRSAAQMWKLLCSPEGLAQWLRPLSEFRMQKGQSFETEGGVFGEVRTLKAGQRARLSWKFDDEQKPSIVQIHVVSRPKGKCILVIQHEGLTDGRRRNEIRQHWKKALADLFDLANSL